MFMLQPVGGKIRIDAGIVGYGREVHDEEEPQHYPCQSGSQKEPVMSAQQAEHVGNIALGV